MSLESSASLSVTMNTALPESWAQDVATKAKLPVLNPAAAKALTMSVETQLRVVLDIASKFQRRENSTTFEGMNQEM